MTSPAIAPPVDLGDRRTYIGASEAAACLGLSKWENATPYVKWEEKLGMRPPFEGNNRTRRGIALEPFIALEYERRHNCDLVTPAEMVHPKHDFIRAHLDRLVVGKPELFVEIKTAAREVGWGEPGTDAIPEDYLAQTAVQFACYQGSKVCHIVADLGGTEDVEYVVARNDRLSDSVVEQLVEFWQRNVLGKLPPDPVTEADCKRRWAVSQGKVFHATADDVALLLNIKETRAAKRASESLEESLMLEWRKRVTDCEAVMYEGKPFATFKTVTRKPEEKPRAGYSYRDLRIKGGE